MECKETHSLSHLEQIIFQLQSSDSNNILQVLCLTQPNQNEQEKIDEVLETRENIFLTKIQKKGITIKVDLDQSLQYLLSQPLKTYQKELGYAKACNCLSVIINQYSLMDNPNSLRQFSLTEFKFDAYMKLDFSASNALSLFAPISQQLTLNNDLHTSNTIFSLLSKRCLTIIGKRKMEHFLRYPLQDPDIINQRLDLVELFANNKILKSYIQDKFLKFTPDIDILIIKFYNFNQKKVKHGCQLKDVVRVYQLVQNLVHLRDYLTEAISPEDLQLYSSNFNNQQAQIQQKQKKQEIEQQDKKNKLSNIDQQIFQNQQNQNSQNQYLQNKNHNNNYNKDQQTQLQQQQQQQSIDDSTKNYTYSYKMFMGKLNKIVEQFAGLVQVVEKGVNLEKVKKKREYQVSIGFSKQLKKLTKVLQQIVKAQDYVKDNLEQTYMVKLSIEKSEKENSYLYSCSVKDYEKMKKQQKEFKIGEEGQDIIEAGVTKDKKKELMQFTTQQMIQLDNEFNEFYTQLEDERNKAVNLILQIICTYYTPLELAREFISDLDAYISLAELSQESHFKLTRPIFNLYNSQINIKRSIHPLLDGQNIVSNDLTMNQNEMHIITGPNMGGKSTYLRQMATIILLAHIGSLVPAEYAEIPIIDSIITRVGASDNQMRGISTFMQEMIETQCLLSDATTKSFMVIDELGRGTSTQEGYGLAYSIAQYIVEKIGGYCLFATHFHELTKLEQDSFKVKNYNLVTEGDKIQYSLEKGVAKDSYAIKVMEMLKYDDEIVKLAKNKLQNLMGMGDNIKKQEMVLQITWEMLQKINQSKSSVEQQDLVKKLIEDIKSLTEYY